MPEVKIEKIHFKEKLIIITSKTRHKKEKLKIPKKT